MDRLLGSSRYRVVASLDEGGMGEIYELAHVGLGRRCVLKVLRASYAERHDLAARLENEARVLAALSSRGTPTLFDMGHLADGRPYLVMERISGSDLSKARNAMELDAAVETVIALLETLSEVHEAGYVHRDVKLDNVIVTEDGRVVLIDFGIARRHDDELRITRQGLTLGSPRSMAPERHSERGGDERSDLYAVGLLLYELLAGAGPFDDLMGDVRALRAAHAFRLPKPLAERSVFVPSRVEAVLQRALAKDPADRFSSAREMVSALSASLSMEAEDPTEFDPQGLFDDEDSLGFVWEGYERPLTEALQTCQGTGPHSAAAKRHQSAMMRGSIPAH